MEIENSTTNNEGSSITGKNMHVSTMEGIENNANPDVSIATMKTRESTTMAIEKDNGKEEIENERNEEIIDKIIPAPAPETVANIPNTPNSVGSKVISVTRRLSNDGIAPTKLPWWDTEDDGDNASESSIEYKEDVVVQVPDNKEPGDIMFLDKEQIERDENMAIRIPTHEYMDTTSDGNSVLNGNRYLRVNIPKPTQNSKNPGDYIDVETPSSPSHYNIHHQTSILCSPTKEKDLRRSKRQRAVPKELHSSKCNVGDRYQVDLYNIPDPKNFAPTFETDHLYKQIWDPLYVKNEITDAGGQKIYDILDNLPTNYKEIMMEAMHESDYHISNAWFSALERIKELQSNGNLPGEDIPADIEKDFFDMIWNTDKDVVHSIKEIRKNHDISKCTLLTHYYRRYKPTDTYLKVKEKKSKEAEFCVVCDDGGVLIFCDKCNGTYHLGCLNPPLTAIPEGVWLCPKCLFTPNDTENTNNQIHKAMKENENVSNDIRKEGGDEEPANVTDTNRSTTVSSTSPKVIQAGTPSTKIVPLTSKWSYWGINSLST